MSTMNTLNAINAISSAASIANNNNNNSHTSLVTISKNLVDTINCNHSTLSASTTPVVNHVDDRLPSGKLISNATAIFHENFGNVEYFSY